MTTPTPGTALRAVPETVRAIAYWSSWLLGSVVQGTTVIWTAIAAASPDVAMPVWLIIGAAGIGFLQSQLGALAGANLPAAHDVVRRRRRRRKPPAD